MDDFLHELDADHRRLATSSIQVKQNTFSRLNMYLPWSKWWAFPFRSWQH